MGEPDSAVTDAPSGDFEIAPSTDAGGNKRVILRLRPAFRACYLNVLKGDPEAGGKVTLTIQIDAQGAPKSVTTKLSGRLPRYFGDCIASSVRQARFQPPDARHSPMVVPLVFANAL